MALSKIPGPGRFGDDRSTIDPGTLARMPSPSPGPIGLWIVPPVFMAPKSAAPAKLGITVHAQSRISAQEWVKKINASNDVPDYFKEQIKSAGNIIFVTSLKKFRVPNNVIPRDWLPDWLSAFGVLEWEMTTGCLDFSVKKGDSAGPFIKVVHNPDLGSGETISGFTRHTMTETSRDPKSVAVERGNTLPTGVTLSSGRKLIVVADRISLSLDGKVKIFKFEDSELLEVWFHEIACHAGRNSSRKPDVHGEKEVESCAKDIQEMFPKSTTVAKVFGEIEQFLKKP